MSSSVSFVALGTRIAESVERVFDRHHGNPRNIARSRSAILCS